MCAALAIRGFICPTPSGGGFLRMMKQESALEDRGW
jgi:hypothetical protein